MGYDVTVEMREVKTIICDIQQQSLLGCAVRAKDNTLVEDEQHSFYLLARERRNEDKKFISKIKAGSEFVTDIKDILTEGEKFYVERFGSIKMTSTENVHNYLSNSSTILRDEDGTHLIAGISDEELGCVIREAKNNTAPGPDGIPYEFYRRCWGTIKHELLGIFEAISKTNEDIGHFSDGIIIHLPKKSKPLTFYDFRPITLLNADYKLFNKVLAKRIHKILPQIINSGQSAAVPGRSIIHTLSALRDVIMFYDNHPEEKAALISLDLRRAFDQVQHTFVWETMHVFGFPEQLISTLKKLYSQAQSRLLINGHQSGPISIKSSVRQGCPMSMILFVISIEPLIRAVASRLTGLQVGNDSFSVRAFADDISVLINTEEEEQCVQIEHQKYSLVSGSEINLSKSGLLPLGCWIDKEANTWLTRVKSLKNLGLMFKSKLDEMSVVNWNIALNKVRQTLYGHTVRSMDLIQRVWFVNMFVMSKVWYTAQIISTDKVMYQKFEQLIGRFVWSGCLYRVARNQLRLPFRSGGLNLVDVEKKCKSLFVRNIICGLSGSGDAFDANFLRLCVLQHSSAAMCRNVHKSIRTAIHLIDSLPVVTMQNGGYQRTRNIYQVLMREACIKPQIEEKYPARRWKSIWSFVTQRNVPSNWKATTYAVVNEIVPTKDKRKRHGMVSSDECSLCHQQDTLEHRLTTCDGADVLWTWTMQKIQQMTGHETTFTIADILRMDVCDPSRDRLNAMKWLLMGVIHWTLYRKHKLNGSLSELKCYLRRHRWKICTLNRAVDFGKAIYLI